MAPNTALFTFAIGLLAACSSAPTESGSLPDGGRAGSPAGGETHGPVDAGPPPTPPLAFVYDSAKGRLHARVKLDTPAGAVVYARTLRADATASGDVDCTQLAKSASPIARDGGEALDGVLDLVGPAVSADLLPSIYRGQTKERLSRSVIEGCLVDAKGGVLAGLTMSLMAAWDAFAPVKLVDATTRLHGVQAYAAACEDDLGELSLFDKGALDCVGGAGAQIVPITVSNPSSPDTIVTSLDGTTAAFPLTGARLAAASRCDRPAWLGYSGDQSSVSQCSPFSRVMATVNSKGTRIVVACRRYALRAKDDTAFDDINMIAHNPTTGKTCFFNSRLENPQDASHIPSPRSAEGDRFWMDVRDVASVQCTNCHDADPWIHSPWIDQLKGAGGHALVPKIGDDSAYSIATKYSVFARESLTVPTPGGDVAWEQPSQLVDAGKCGGCHRIGSQASVVEWVARSVGDGSQASWFNRWVSDAYRTTAKLRWMSPNAAGNPTDAADDAAAVRAILACGQRGATCETAPTPH